MSFHEESHQWPVTRRQSWPVVMALIAFCAIVNAADVKDAPKSRTTVGAIRWDAWAGGDVTAQVEATLGPEKYHNRLPWFAEVTGKDTVCIRGGTQEVMDREIDFAAEAGLDYWAFLLYSTNSNMSVPLSRYLASAKRGRVGFCVILRNTLGLKADEWPAERDRTIALLGEPGYQRVLDGRPLVYMFIDRDIPWDRVAEFNSAARAAGHNPYLVHMCWNPLDYAKVRDLGVDAVSAYAKVGTVTNFVKLAESCERDWKTAAQKAIPYVPLVTAGWDKRPRQDHPVRWEPVTEGSYHNQKTWPSRATAAELTDHFRRAIAFVRDNPRVCPANTVIVYAWNEYDEGGWIAPTRGSDGAPDTERITALRAARTADH